MTGRTTARAKVWRLAASLLALAGAARMEARGESLLRVAMTAGDIPDWTGQPDQGFEGYRFVGWSLYDALINWDLSRSDREASLTPGLATKWTIDPANNKRWIIELRKGVKFHDGCELTADLVVWNIQIGGQLATVVELHALAQLDDPALVVGGIDRPFGGETWRQRRLPVGAGQVPVDQRVIERPADEAIAFEPLVRLAGPVR